MKFKVMYVLGDGSSHDNQELRWSLRSLEKFCLDEVEPVVVGRVPDWFLGDSLKADDPTNRKNKNIMYKVAYGIQAGIVSGEFLFSSDDHFLVKHYSFASGPRWIKNPMLKELPVGAAATGWDRLTDATRRALLGAGYPAMDFEHHFNTYFRTEDIDLVRDIVSYAEKAGLFEKGILVPSVFNNAAIVNGSRRPMSFKRDYKFGNLGSGEMMAELARDDCFGISINDDAFNCPPFMKLMSDMFPNKSKWEK